MKIYLIGLPSSGKTTLGKQLAHSINSKFIDMDELIEEKENKTIAEIFAQQGEEHFRKIEKQTLTEMIALEDEKQIISTGGGAPCFFDNMRQMNEDGLTVYLNVSPQELVKRLKGSGTATRPLLQGKKEQVLEDELSKKLAQRNQFYLQAKHILEGDRLHINDLINLVKYVID